MVIEMTIVFRDGLDFVGEDRAYTILDATPPNIEVQCNECNFIVTSLTQLTIEGSTEHRRISCPRCGTIFGYVTSI